MLVFCPELHENLCKQLRLPDQQDKFEGSSLLSQGQGRQEDEAQPRGTGGHCLVYTTM